MSSMYITNKHITLIHNIRMGKKSTVRCANMHTIHVYNHIVYACMYALTRCSHIHDECTDALMLGRLIRGGEQ